MSIIKTLAYRLGLTKPEPRPDFGEALVEQMKQAFTAHGFVLVDEKVRPGIKPPADPAADAMDWGKWRECMQHYFEAHDGWSPCRFANRLGAGLQIGWVFGITKGAFGVWTKPYLVCHHYEETADSAILAAITHLPSGMGIGIFNDRQTACLAVDLVLSMEDWKCTPEIDGSKESKARWDSLMAKARHTWEFNGIDWSTDRHAHMSDNLGSPEIGIWTFNPDNLIEGKPEKLA
jgi:hypothetical protein